MGDIPAGTAGPQVVTPTVVNSVIPQGFVGKHINGDAGKGATAIAVRIKGVGTGYQLVPVGPPDLQTAGMLGWDMSCDFSRDLAAGNYKIQLSAIDLAGNWGPVKDLDLIVTSITPDGRAVLTLTWDSNADLDLILVAPNGKVLTPKSPSTAAPDDAGMIDTKVPGTGVLDRDSNAACVLDNYRQEDVVWSSVPLPGTYQVYVNMFSACGAGYANFNVTLRAEGREVFTKTGTLLDIQANGWTGDQPMTAADCGLPSACTPTNTSQGLFVSTLNF